MSAQNITIFSKQVKPEKPQCNKKGKIELFATNKLWHFFILYRTILSDHVWNWVWI